MTSFAHFGLFFMVDLARLKIGTLSVSRQIASVVRASTSQSVDLGSTPSSSQTKWL